MVERLGRNQNQFQRGHCGRHLPVTLMSAQQLTLRHFRALMENQMVKIYNNNNNDNDNNNNNNNNNDSTFQCSGLSRNYVKAIRRNQRSATMVPGQIQSQRRC